MRCVWKEVLRPPKHGFRGRRKPTEMPFMSRIPRIKNFHEIACQVENSLSQNFLGNRCRIWPQMAGCGAAVPHVGVTTVVIRKSVIFSVHTINKEYFFGIKKSRRERDPDAEAMKGPCLKCWPNPSPHPLQLNKFCDQILVIFTKFGYAVTLIYYCHQCLMSFIFKFHWHQWCSDMSKLRNGDTWIWLQYIKSSTRMLEHN